MPTDKAVELLRQRESATHTKGDIHETDTAYLAACRVSAQEAARLYGWQVVPCLDQEGRVRSVREIHEEIWQRVLPLLKNKGE
jgi:dTMP kinase